MTWAYSYYIVVPKGLLGWVRRLSCCACEISGFSVFLISSCLTAVRSSLWLPFGFAACRLQWDWKIVSQNSEIWHQMKINAFNVDLEALVWINSKDFVTFWLPRGFLFWSSLSVSALFWIDEVSWCFCWDFYCSKVFTLKDCAAWAMS